MGLVQIHARVFSVVVSCLIGGLDGGLRAVLGESAINHMKTCVLLIVTVLQKSVSMNTLLMLM